MGAICKCILKKKEEIECQTKFEENLKAVESVIYELNKNGLSHTGIWPCLNDYLIYKQDVCENIKTRKRICYEINPPLIRKATCIFTLKEYLAGKKILNFLKKLKIKKA